MAINGFFPYVAQGKNFCAVVVKADFFAARVAVRGEDVDVGILVFRGSWLPARGIVDGNVNGAESVSGKQCVRQFLHEAQVLLVSQFARERGKKFAAYASVFALFGAFNGLPEFLAAFRGILRLG